MSEQERPTEKKTQQAKITKWFSSQKPNENAPTTQLSQLSSHLQQSNPLLDESNTPPKFSYTCTHFLNSFEKKNQFLCIVQFYQLRLYRIKFELKKKKKKKKPKKTKKKTCLRWFKIFSKMGPNFEIKCSFNKKQAGNVVWSTFGILANPVKLHLTRICMVHNGNGHDTLNLRNESVKYILIFGIIKQNTVNILCRIDVDGSEQQKFVKLCRSQQ